LKCGWLVDWWIVDGSWTECGWLVDRFGMWILIAGDTALLN